MIASRPAWPTPRIEAILMMVPFFAASIGFAAACEQRNALTTFSSQVRIQSAAVLSKNGFGSMPPALFTSTSIRPNFFRNPARAASTSAGLVTSPTIGSMPLPFAAVSSSVFLWGPTTATRAPSLAKRSAIAWPMPRPPPVTSAVLPSSLTG